MSKEMLQRALQDNYEAQKALPGRFSLWSGKEFTYEPPRYWDEESTLRIRRLYREGELFDSLSNSCLEIKQDGSVKHFSFYSFSGKNEIELNEARIYVRDCSELLSREFTEKVAADYSAKAGEFKSLMESEKNISEQISKIEKEGGAK